MRKMVYRRADGQVVNTMAEAGEKYTIELIPIKPYDEVEALEKHLKERPKKIAERLAKAIARRA